MFELLWELFGRVDRCEDIVFFGDEPRGGSVAAPVERRDDLPSDLREGRARVGRSRSIAS